MQGSGAYSLTRLNELRQNLAALSMPLTRNVFDPIPMRKGKSTHFFYDFKKLEGAQLIKIIGKDRIDLRANKIYVFLRNCAKKHS